MIANEAINILFVTNKLNKLEKCQIIFAHVSILFIFAIQF